MAGKESGEGFHVESTTDTAKYPKGTPFKTVIFAIGSSLKGMGASGLTIEAEEARVKKLIDFCKKNKITVIGVHVGGEAARGPAGSDNERMIDAVAPLCRLPHRDQGFQQGRPFHQDRRKSPRPPRSRSTTPSGSSKS